MWLDRWFSLFSAEEWNAIWTAATFVVAFSAALIALLQFGHHIRTLREQSRPFVIVDYVFRSGTVLIEVRNSGPTAARDVHFDWETPVHSDDERSEVALQRVIVNEGIPFLAPGRAIRFRVGRFSASLQPRHTAVTATYLAPFGRKRFTSVSVLDLDQWAYAVADSDPATRNARSGEKQARASEKTAKALERVGRMLDPISAIARESPAYQAIQEREESEYQAVITSLEQRSVFREDPKASALEAVSTHTTGLRWLRRVRAWLSRRAVTK